MHERTFRIAIHALTLLCILAALGCLVVAVLGGAAGSSGGAFGLLFASALFLGLARAIQLVGKGLMEERGELTSRGVRLLLVLGGLLAIGGAVANGDPLAVLVVIGLVVLLLFLAGRREETGPHERHRPLAVDDTARRVNVWELGAEDFWKLVEWCRSRGAGEIRFRVMDMTEGDFRDRVLDALAPFALDGARGERGYVLTPATVKALRKLFPGGLLESDLEGEGFLDRVALYRSGQLVLDIDPWEYEGAIWMRPEDEESLRALGIPLRPANEHSWGTGPEPVAAERHDTVRDRHR